MANDQDLYRRWLEQRDERAFGDLARRHANLVADVAWRVHRDVDAAEDALQEALFRLAQDGTDRPGTVGVRAWLARAAISIARNARTSDAARRRRETRVASQTREAVMQDQGNEGLPQALDAAMARMGGEDAAILALHYRHGLPTKEIAAVLDVKEGAARTRLSRARQRLRAEAGTETVDGARGRAALAALPALRLPDASVARAIEGALARRPLPPVIPATGISSMPLAAVALAVVVLVGGAAWWVVSSERAQEAGEVAREQAGDTDASAPMLVGRGPDDVPPPTAAATPSTASKSRAKAESTPRREGPNPDGTPIDLRLELVRTGARPVRVEIAQVIYRGTTFNGRFLDKIPDLVRVDPGRPIALSTDDPRAACEFVLARVPDPVPEQLTLQIPHKDDPAETRLTLEIVDARDGRPIPGATLAWGPLHGTPATQRADERGRIELDLAGRPGVEGPALMAFEQAETWIHASGYEGVGSPRGMKEYVPALDADLLAELRRRGVHRIALEPTANPGWKERELRFVHHDGSPASGLGVYLNPPMTRANAAEFDPWHEGLRRTDARGRIVVPMGSVMGLDVRIGADLLASYVIFDQETPRTLRLPPLCKIRLVVGGVPENIEVDWSVDDLGRMRFPVDPPGVAPAWDPAARAWADANEHFVRVGRRTRRESFIGPETTIECLVRTDVTRRIWFFDGSEARAWELPSAPTNDVHRVLWDAMPVHEPADDR
ncbi:MAG: RNA polymerase sigma factor [Planctomycetota bacterium]|nr:RNA polymerase sigma factor [Planctomycetota bacterium]